MATFIRVPKPSYVRSRLVPRKGPDAAMRSVLDHLADLYQLGNIKSCHRAPRSNSLNFIVTTGQGKYVFRKHFLSEETVAHEHQVLSHLQRVDFPAPRMCLDRDGRAWVKVDGELYSVYRFVTGFCPADFWWWPSARRDIISRTGRILAEYHQAVTGLVPSFFKWDGYRPTEHKRWRNGDLYHQALKDIRRQLRTSAATQPLDDFARSRIDAIEQLLELESAVEERTDLSKAVIHGDFAPWNVLLRPDGSLFILDFNAARLDLKVFDVILATFWFSWRGSRLDRDRAVTFQTGYSQTGHLSEIDVRLASDIFQWMMARSIAERLRTHYLERRFLIREPASLEAFYQMCVFARQQPHQLMAGLRGES